MAQSLDVSPPSSSSTAEGSSTERQGQRRRQRERQAHPHGHRRHHFQNEDEFSTTRRQDSSAPSSASGGAGEDGSFVNPVKSPAGAGLAAASMDAEAQQLNGGTALGPRHRHHHSPSRGHRSSEGGCDTDDDREMGRRRQQRYASSKLKRSDVWIGGGGSIGSSFGGVVGSRAFSVLPRVRRRLSSLKCPQQQRQQRPWHANVRKLWLAFLLFVVLSASLSAITIHVKGVMKRQARRRREREARRNNPLLGGDGNWERLDDEAKARMLGLGKLERRGILPWELESTGRDPARDRLVKWWKDNPAAPVGLSCAAFSGGGMEEERSGGRGNHEDGDVYDDDAPKFDDGDGDGIIDDDGGDDAAANGDGNEQRAQSSLSGLQDQSQGMVRQSRRAAAAASSDANFEPESSAVTATGPSPSSGLAIDPVADTYFYHGYGIPPPVFKGRTPSTGSAKRVQVAFVVPFVEFQLSKVAALLQRHWSRYPPCMPGTPEQSADLVFFTEQRLSDIAQRRVIDYYGELGPERTGCFRTDEPKFLSLAEVDAKLSHLEGAAFTFYSLFHLLEKQYRTFFLAEPDVAPVQPNFLPAVVDKSRTVNCEDDGYWQVGSIPLARDVDAGMLRERLDYHMNGNALYVLGCPDFEDYRCRVQTFYVPKDDCALVAGCQTHEAYEGGYDHALYRFRMHPDNYEYSRLVLQRFGYSHFVQNRGEGVYDPEEIVRNSPSTYFVHSKSIYMTDAATILKEVTVSVLKRDVCDRDAATEKVLQQIYRYLRGGEYSKADAVRHLCDAAKYNLFGPRPASKVCDMYRAIGEAGADNDNWTNPLAMASKAGTGTGSAAAGSSGGGAGSWRNRMPGRAYLWTMDFHGGPTNCDLSVITEAGGAVHAEIDGICDYYGLCRDRLKVIRADNWKEFDPSEKQIADFRKAYENDPEFERVDAFICHHPVANCELFLPFNRSIIVHATTRLEFGRHDEGIDWRLSSGYDRDVGKEKWKQWVRTIRRLAVDDRNVIAANNLYDRDYIKYFTGVKNVELLPSWCGDGIGVKFCEPGWESSLTHGWLPTRPEVVIVPYRSNLDRTRYKTGVRDPADHPIIKELAAVPRSISNGTQVKMIRELYSDANPLRMLKHPAVVILPYQVSTMQLVELYRLNIPTFCPSLSLLKRWCREHDLMWEVHYGWPEYTLRTRTKVPDPNGRPMMDKYSKEWEDMFDHWIAKSDFYQLDDIHYFDSWEHFYRQYEGIRRRGGLDEIHRRMARTNLELRESLVEQWRGVLDRVRKEKLLF